MFLVLLKVLSASFDEAKGAATQATRAASRGTIEQDAFRELADALLDPSTGRALKTWTCVYCLPPTYVTAERDGRARHLFV